MNEGDLLSIISDLLGAGMNDAAEMILAKSGFATGTPGQTFLHTQGMIGGGPVTMGPNVGGPGFGGMAVRMAGNQFLKAFDTTSPWQTMAQSHIQVANAGVRDAVQRRAEGIITERFPEMTLGAARTMALATGLAFGNVTSETFALARRTGLDQDADVAKSLTTAGVAMLQARKYGVLQSALHRDDERKLTDRIEAAALTGDMGESEILEIMTATTNRKIAYAVPSRYKEGLVAEGADKDRQNLGASLRRAKNLTGLGTAQVFDLLADVYDGVISEQIPALDKFVNRMYMLSTQGVSIQEYASKNRQIRQRFRAAGIEDTSYVADLTNEILLGRQSITQQQQDAGNTNFNYNVLAGKRIERAVGRAGSNVNRYTGIMISKWKASNSELPFDEWLKERAAEGDPGAMALVAGGNEAIVWTDRANRGDISPELQNNMQRTPMYARESAEYNDPKWQRHELLSGYLPGSMKGRIVTALLNTEEGEGRNRAIKRLMTMREGDESVVIDGKRFSGAEAREAIDQLAWRDVFARLTTLDTAEEEANLKTMEQLHKPMSQKALSSVLGGIEGGEGGSAILKTATSLYAYLGGAGTENFGSYLQSYMGQLTGREQEDLYRLTEESLNLDSGSIDEMGQFQSTVEDLTKRAESGDAAAQRQLEQYKASLKYASFSDSFAAAEAGEGTEISLIEKIIDLVEPIRDWAVEEREGKSKTPVGKIGKMPDPPVVSPALVDGM